MASNVELPDIGYQFIIKTVRIAFECAFYGIYLLLISTSTIILCRKIRVSPKASGFLLLVTIVMFGASTVFLTMDMIDIIKRFQIILMDNPEASLQAKQDLADTTLQQWMWTGEMLFIFMLILGDSVVIWRTWALFRDTEKYLIAPILTWIGSVVAAFYELGCDVKNGWVVQSTDPSAGSVGLQSCAKADTTSFSLSYATNIICTTFIMYKAWMYRRSMSQYLGSARRRTQVEKIMTLLVESGAIYLALYTFQAVPIYGGHFSAGSFVAVEAVNAIIQQAMGMYPTAIVILVEMQRSIYDTEQVTRERGVGTASGMVFAARDLTTTEGRSTTTSRHLHAPVTLDSSGDNSKHTASTKVELGMANMSKDSIPGKS
ncbi:hypothetical protein P691DRAFT_667446 [Macrolepiota fuliginosa MF-IS2]|uniref:Uncharacterized protein n=1 Tax=Macrolepiota fuliginosa MF-IS2 TaxID=1400762 RepID=A0A9P5XEB4_9AGAR|nr:hypothetical protein P691DRAFT_667446 [Macrolepiota fuliginosa MF-IS2]